MHQTTFLKNSNNVTKEHINLQNKEPHKSKQASTWFSCFLSYFHTKVWCYNLQSWLIAQDCELSMLTFWRSWIRIHLVGVHVFKSKRLKETIRSTRLEAKKGEIKSATSLRWIILFMKNQRHHTYMNFGIIIVKFQQSICNYAYTNLSTTKNWDLKNWSILIGITLRVIVWSTSIINTASSSL